MKIIAIILLVTLTYYGIVISIAKQETTQIIEESKTSVPIELSLDKLTQRQIDILLKVQDPNFFNHKGTDFSTPGAGITTVTQALVKKLYYENFKPGIAKLRQSLIARYALDPQMTKNDQLELFINIASLGINNSKPVIGFSQAAEKYYNKPFEQLTENEYISIVAMLIAPQKFHIKVNPEKNQNRVERIKLLIDGKYEPKSLMDLYYGGNTFSTNTSKINKMIWGY